jgi:hypothetical protein
MQKQFKREIRQAIIPKSSNIRTPRLVRGNAASKTASGASFKLGWKRNPKYDDATHAIWWVGQESWESFCKREFGKVRPNPFRLNPI